MFWLFLFFVVCFVACFVMEVRSYYGDGGWLFLGLFFLMCALVNGAMLSSRTSCHKLESAMEIPTQWDILIGCMVKRGDTWIPFDKYRFTEEVK